MAETVFNIFGNHLSAPKNKNLNVHKNICENANVGKAGLSLHTPAKGGYPLTPTLLILANVGKAGLSLHTPAKGGYPLTPTKKNNLMTPKNVEKKSFLQNTGAPFQSILTPKEAKWSVPNNFKKLTLQVYEDKPVTEEEIITLEDLAAIEYSGKPYIDEDDCEQEFKLSKSELQQMVFGLPERVAIPPLKKMQMEKDDASFLYKDDLGDTTMDSSFIFEEIQDSDLPDIF